MKKYTTIAIIAMALCVSTINSLAVGDMLTKAKPLAQQNLVPEMKLELLATKLVGDFKAASVGTTNTNVASQFYVDTKNAPSDPSGFIDALINDKAAATLSYVRPGLWDDCRFVFGANGNPRQKVIGFDDHHGYKEEIVLLINKNAPALDSFLAYCKTDRAQKIIADNGFRPLEHSDRR